MELITVAFAGCVGLKTSFVRFILSYGLVHPPNPNRLKGEKSYEWNILTHTLNLESGSAPGPNFDSGGAVHRGYCL